MQLGILVDNYGDYKKYKESCEFLEIPYKLINFWSSSWYEELQKSLNECDGYLATAPHIFQEQNSVVVERLYFLNKILKKPIYPSFNELFLYENKRNMITWMKIHNIPHPESKVFIDKQECLKYIESTKFPIVIKSNLGSAGSGVWIVGSKLRAKWIVENVFGRISPYLTLGQPKKKKKWGINWPTYGNSERHTIIIQKFYPSKWEWRIIKIGNSYFGHKKLLKGNFASGSGLVGWVQPPFELFDLVRDICDQGNFYSMAVDILETEQGKILVNELQSLFGSYLDSQMYINGTPGRFRYVDGQYIFEEGKYNIFGSYLLRVEHFIDILQSYKE